MKPYSKYKDSGIEWLGEIPEHWRQAKLKFYVNIETGNTPPKSDENNYINGEFPWVKPDELAGLSPIVDSKEKLSEKGTEYARIIPANSVLVCCIGTIGKIGVSGCKLATNQQINSVIFNNENLIFNYGKYLLLSSEKELCRNANKVVVAILNKTGHGDISIATPPPHEQWAIADFLDSKTAQIDRLVTIKEEQIKLLEKKRAAVINQAVTKGLDPDVKMKDSGIEWLGKIPEHWDCNRFKYICSL